MGENNPDFRKQFKNEYGYATQEKKNDFRQQFQNSYGYATKSKNYIQSYQKQQQILAAKKEEDAKLREEAAKEYAEMVARGKRNQSIFSDNELFQQQLRQETGPNLYDLMTDEEKEKFYYETGKGGNSAGKAYLKEITPQLQKAAFENTRNKTYEESKNSVLAGLANNMLASMGMGAGYIDDAIRTITGKELNPYSIGHTMSEVENVSRQAIKETARENIADSAVTDFLVDTGLSMGQTVARLPFGSYGLAIAGLGAATKGAEDARERGATNTQVLLSGGAQGAAEALAEKFSLGSLKGMKEVPVYTVKDVAKNVLKQMGTEASEEAVTELANTITDRIIMSDKSNWTAMKEQYMEQGDSESTATLKAIADVTKNIAISGAGGALSGGIMGGGISGLNAISQSRIGKSSGITNYQEFAESIDTDKNTYEREEDHGRAMQLQQIAQEFADRQAGGEELSNLERGRFEQDLYEFQNALNQNEKTEIAPVQDENLRLNNEIKETDNKTEGINNQTEEKTDRERYEEIREWSKDLGKNGQEAFVKNYDGSSERLEEYENAFKRYYDAGRYNVDMEVADKFAMAAILTPEQAAAAYKAGAQDRNLAQNNRSTYRQGEAKTGSMTDLTGRAGADQKNVLSHMGKKTGLDFEIVEGDGNAYGSYNQKEGVIRISLDTDNFLQTTSHELTHFVESYAPEHYEGYKSIAISALMQAQGVDYNTLYRNYEKRYEETGTTVTRDKVLNEIVADATGKFLNDEEFINNVAKENRTVAQKIMDFISDMIDSIKNLMSGKGIRKAAEALNEQLEYYENARDMWAYALEEAGNRYKSGMEIEEDNTKEQFMLAHPEEVSDAKIEENFNYVRNMNPVATLRGDEFTRRDIKVSEQILEYYDSFGNVVHNDVVGDILLNKRSVKDDVAHGIGRLKSIGFQAVPEVLKNGKVLQYEKQWKGRSYDTVTIGARVDVEEGVCAGEYYVACIVKVDETNRMYLHEVHTTKMDDTAPFWTGGDSKAVLPGGGNHPSISSIFEKLVNVNETRGKEKVRLQIQNIDSDGNELSEQQRKFFKDSKVRDSEGKLLVMYHGTPNKGFTKFRSGTYFTENPEYAEKYQNPNSSILSRKKNTENPGTYKVYLNIKKPFDTRIPSVKKIWDTMYYRKWGTGTPLMESGLPDWTDGMDIQEFIEENELDFDGIILDEGGVPDLNGGVQKRGLSYIILSANQVKNIDNTEPTNDPDIRFQLKDPMEETKNLIAIHNLTADKLLKTFQLDGIPMPSIAITKTDIGHENFGEISLLFRKDTIDPKKKKNKVYSADAWTPTFPRIEYEASRDVIRNASAFVEEFKKHLPEEYYHEARRTMGQLEEYLQTEGSEKKVANRLKEKTAVKALYLASQGDTIEEKTKVVRSEKEKNPMFDEFLELFEEDIETLRKMPYNMLREKYVDRMKEVAIRNGRTEEQAEMLLAKKSGMIGGFSKMIDRLIRYAEKPGVTEATVIDYESMKNDIESRIDNAGFEMWVDNLVSGLSKNMGISNGKELFTSAGKRRSFEDTHFAVTAKNIVKSMLSQGENVNNIAGFHGIKTVRAAAVDEFKSIKGIKAAEEKIQNFTEEEFEEISDRLSDRLYKVIDGILTASVNDADYNRLTRMDYIGELIQDACNNPTEENIRKQFANTLWKVTDEQVREIKSIIDETRNMPVNMFEAKPQRVVEYDEIEAAVVPDNVSAEVLAALDEKGIRTVTYNAAEQGARAKAVNSVEGIRFQLQDVDDSSDLDTLLAENAELKKANEYLEQQLNSTKDYAPGLQDIEKIATKLRKDYNSSYSKERLTENLQKLYNYIRTSEQVDGDEVTRAATAIGRSIIEKAEMKDTAMKEQYQDLLDRLKNTKIVLPERFRSELETVGGYSNFRKRYFGKLRIGNSGVDVDTAYEELASLYPGMFDESIVNPADQIIKIAEVVDMVRPTIKNPYHADMDEMAYLVGQEIFREYFNVRSLEPTRMDKMEAEVFKIRQKYDEQLEAYKVRLKAEYEGDMSQAEKEFVRQRQELSRQYNALPKDDRVGRARIREQLRELEANKDINKDIIVGKLRYQKRKNASEARKHKERIIKDVSEMAVWLEKPTDKKHVPEALRVPLADFLKDVDFSSNRPNANGDPTSRSNAWRDLKDLFSEIVANGGLSDVEGDFYMEVDPDIAKKMDSLKTKVQDFDKMENLDIKDLRTLREVVQSMKRCVLDANIMYENKNYERIEDVAFAFQKDSANRKDKVEYAGNIGKAMRMMQSEMLDPNTMFERMGPAATSVYQELRDGFDRKIQNTKIAQDYMAELLTANNISEKDIRQWSSKKAKVHEFDINGKKLKFTTAQIMSLYAQNKREQARGHIYSEVGGIKTAPTVRYDQKKKAYVIDKSSAPVKVNPLDVENITSVLTPEQKNMADGIVKFFTTQTSEWGNEVTMRMYGYKKFMAPNYFPIVTDKNYLATKNTELENSITTLKNMGATKSTVYKANNPIIIEDIFDVFTRQADQMGSYNAFVIPLSDMQKFLNHKVKGEGSVKETIDRIFGAGGQDYIKQLMVDVNGTSTGTKDLTSAMVRNMKAASVGANLRTAIQQPTAYARAMVEIDLKYLMEGLTKKSNDWEMAKKYAPIVQWKEWGYFDINTGRSMKNILMSSESLRESLIEKSMWLTGKADEIAWKHLWEAAKAETRDLYPDLKEGSEEFYTQAGKRLTEIVDKTQVVDSVLHRSKLMKSNNGLVQMYTSFMSEPTKTYNMLYRAIAEYGINKNPENKKKLKKTLITWAVSNAVTAMAAAVIDAMRDEDDEKTLPEKYVTAITENMIDNSNPANMVPLLRDVVSIFSGYQVQRTDMQAVQQAYYAWNKIVKYANGESELTLPGLMYDCSKTISLMTGVPVNNALRDLNAAVNTVLGEAGAVEAIYSKERLFKEIKSTDNLKRYVSLAMKAYYKGDKEIGNRIIADLKVAGIDEEKIKTKYKAFLKDNSLVVAAAEARLSGNYGEYNSLVDELEAQGLVREYVEGAVASVGNKLDPDANLQTGYGYSDATRAYRTSKAEFERVVNGLIEQKNVEKAEAGKEFDESDVISQIKSRFTKEYKEEYVNGNDAKRKEIRTSLYQVKVKGKQLFTEQDFKNWIKK